MQEQDIERQNKVQFTLLNVDQSKVSIGISTDPIKQVTFDDVPYEKEYPMDAQLENIEKKELREKEIELEMKKKELNHFYGSNAFQLMKNLSNQVVKKFIDTGEHQQFHFPWIKEYKRFVSKCQEEEVEKRQNQSSYNLTEDINKAKRKEWWYRQKYKLMKSLKQKWDQSYKKTYRIVQKLKENYVNKLPVDSIDYNHLNET
jgi:hypothetical protein